MSNYWVELCDIENFRDRVVKILEKYKNSYIDEVLVNKIAKEIKEDSWLKNDKSRVIQAIYKVGMLIIDIIGRTHQLSVSLHNDVSGPVAPMKIKNPNPSSLFGNPPPPIFVAAPYPFPNNGNPSPINPSLVPPNPIPNNGPPPPPPQGIGGTIPQGVP